MFKPSIDLCRSMLFSNTGPKCFFFTVGSGWYIDSRLTKALSNVCSPVHESIYIYLPGSYPWGISWKSRRERFLRARNLRELLQNSVSWILWSHCIDQVPMAVVAITDIRISRSSNVQHWSGRTVIRIYPRWEAMTTKGGWAKRSHCSLRIWCLAGYPWSGGWSYTYCIRSVLIRFSGEQGVSMRIRLEEKNTGWWGRWSWEELEWGSGRWVRSKYFAYVYMRFKNIIKNK